MYAVGHATSMAISQFLTHRPGNRLSNGILIKAIVREITNDMASTINVTNTACCLRGDHAMAQG